jgi:hypothetical protein
MKASIESNQSWTKSKVTLFDHALETGAATMSFTDIQKLRDSLYYDDQSASGPRLSDTTTFRLFIVRDLSHDLVELFGSRFNIDPLFFEAHVDLRDQSKRFEASCRVLSIEMMKGDTSSYLGLLLNRTLLLRLGVLYGLARITTPTMLLSVS